MAKPYNYGIGNWNEVYANSDEERQELLIAKAKERIKSTEFSEMLRDYYSWRAGQTFDSDDILVKQSTPQDPDFDEIRRIQNMNEADLLEHMFEDRTWRTNNTVGIANDWNLMGKAADSQNYLRKQQWAHIQEVYDLMPNRFLNFSGADTADPRGTLHWLGDALYSVVIDPVNLFPIPALDGGRLMFVLLEGIRGGKRISPQKEGFIHLAGFMLLIGLVVVMSYFDIMRILSGERFF